MWTLKKTLKENLIKICRQSAVANKHTSYFVPLRVLWKVLQVSAGQRGNKSRQIASHVSTSLYTTFYSKLRKYLFLHYFVHCFVSSIMSYLGHDLLSWVMQATHFPSCHSYPSHGVTTVTLNSDNIINATHTTHTAHGTNKHCS